MGEALGSSEECLDGAGLWAAVSGPGEAGEPAGRSPGASSAGAAPPGRAARRRAGVVGRVAGAREPKGEALGVSEAAAGLYGHENTSG